MQLLTRCSVRDPIATRSSAQALEIRKGNAIGEGSVITMKLNRRQAGSAVAGAFGAMVPIGMLAWADPGRESSAARNVDPDDPWRKSPTYGFFVTWGKGWSLDGDGFETTSAPDRTDTIALRFEDATLTITAAAVEDLDPDTALEDAVTTVQRDHFGGDVPPMRLYELRDGTRGVEIFDSETIAIIDARPLTPFFVTITARLVAPAADIEVALASTATRVAIDNQAAMADRETRILDSQEPPAETGVDDTTYVSPTYGYRLSWAADAWYVENAEVDESEGDTLTLRNRLTASLTIESRMGDAPDPAECVAAEWNRSPSSGGMRDIQPARNADGVIIAGETGTAAYAVFSYMRVGDHGEDLGIGAAYTECRLLADGETLVTIAVRVAHPLQFNQAIAPAFAVIATFQEAGTSAPTPLTAAVDEVLLAEDEPRD